MCRRTAAARRGPRIGRPGSGRVHGGAGAAAPRTRRIELGFPCPHAKIPATAAPVAQLDRASPSSGEGRAFESRRGRHLFSRAAAGSRPRPTGAFRMTHPVLSALGLGAEESGTYLGNGEWGRGGAGVLEPVNPATEEVLGRVAASSEAEYETIVERPQAAFKVWRTTPAPRRGEAVRLCAEALRRHKDALGSLVALEMGKSKPEGDGEVQEMIDIGEFAVGLSRQL